MIDRLRVRLRSALAASAAIGLLTLAQSALAQDFIWAPDFPVGAAIPEISAQDQDGQLRSFDNLVGEKGLLLVFSRSFDW